MFRPFLLAAAAVLALGGCAARTVPVEGAATSAVPAIDVALMQRLVARLASDEFEGRAPSTAAEPKVLDAIVAAFAEAGLRPGNRGQWLQEVPTVEITAQDPTPLTVSGGARPLAFAVGKDFVAASYRVTPRTVLADSELVFVGYGINAPELGWNDYAGLDMRGKIAVILVNDPDYAIVTEAGLFKGRRMTYYGRWTYKFEEAARQGAAAALIVHDTFPAAYPWKVVESSWTGAQYYVATANDAMDQTQANGWLQKAAAEAIVGAAGKDFASLSAAAGRQGFRAVPLGLKASLGFGNAIRRAPSHNVVGILPGRETPDEVVLYTAHWDHLGRCTPDAAGDDICNGAVDNATGIAALVALAKANAEAGPAARSQVFLAVTLEESGLLGSEWYARHPLHPLDRIAGGVNMDALLPAGEARDIAPTGGDKSELTAVLDAALAAMGLVRSPEPRPERGSFYRSDHFSLAKVGVPMFSLGRGNDLKDGGVPAGEAAREDYVANRYHSPNDEFDPAWDWSGIRQEVELYYRLGRALADSRAWPNWHSGDEFRAVRDKSCAAAPGGC